jgi:FemAB-related protein (PEP-CTERM system-associated)
VAGADRGVDATAASDTDARAWDEFVDARSGPTGYHLWRWRRVFSRAFGHEPIYLVARQGSQLVGVLPLVYISSVISGRTLTSLPFLNYGGVLADSDAAADRLLELAVQVARSRQCKHLELRHVGRRFPGLPCRQHKVTMLLTIEDGMWDRLDRKVRNQIRKAQKSGLVVERGGGELLGDFYAVFARNMRDLGTPVYSKRLFDEVLEAFPDRARVHVVRREGRPVAAGLSYRTRTTIEMPWASSVRDFNALCPNHLLYWNAIESTADAGCRTFDFGRSTPGEGTFKFKEQWGAQPVPLHWEYDLLGGTSLPNLGTSNPRFHMAIEAWKRLPLAVATRLGPHIVRAIP